MCKLSKVFSDTLMQKKNSTKGRNYLTLHLLTLIITWIRYLMTRSI